jgi:ribosomal protein L40E
MSRCARCDAEIPEGGQFCIECGAPADAAPAATGATERLPEYSGGPICAACGTHNPVGADFCVMCGRSLGSRPVAEPPLDPVPPPAPAAPIAPRAVSQPALRSPASRSHAPLWGGVSGGVFLIGLALLFAFNWWWPGILVLLGLTSLIGSMAAGKSFWAGLQGALWLLGIAVLAAFNWWWPGILVLVGISAILGSVLRPHH